MELLFDSVVDCITSKTKKLELGQRVDFAQRTNRFDKLIHAVGTEVQCEKITVMFTTVRHDFIHMESCGTDLLTTAVTDYFSHFAPPFCVLRGLRR